MPAQIEKALKKAAKKKGLKGNKINTYIYGTMKKSNKKPKIKAQ